MENPESRLTEGPARQLWCQPRDRTVQRSMMLNLENNGIAAAHGSVGSSRRGYVGSTATRNGPSYVQLRNGRSSAITISRCTATAPSRETLTTPDTSVWRQSQKASTVKPSAEAL